jgi:hypothetical protein
MIEMSEAGLSESDIRDTVQPFLGVVGDAETRLAYHKGIVGAVPHNYNLVQRDPQVTGKLIHNAGLSCCIDDLAGYPSGESAVPDFKTI